MNPLEALDEQIKAWLHKQSKEEEKQLAAPSPAKILEWHRLGFKLYNEKKFDKALIFYRLLVLANPSEAKYWKGLGACLQMTKSYEIAIHCYIAAQTLNPIEKTDPALFVHTADCFFALDKKEDGLIALQGAKKYASKKHHQEILAHVEFMQDVWSKHLTKRVL